MLDWKKEKTRRKTHIDKRSYRKRKMMIRKWWKSKLIGFKVFK